MNTRIALAIVVALAVLAAVFYALRDDDGPPPTTPTPSGPVVSDAGPEISEIDLPG